MTRVDRDKYWVLIRGDYLYALSRLSPNRQERDKLIQRAVESFLQDSLETRKDEILAERPRVRIAFAPGHVTHHMYLEFVSLPDDLVEQMDRVNRQPLTNTPAYDSLGTVLNAAIKTFLLKHHPEFLPDLGQDKVNFGVADPA